MEQRIIKKVLQIGGMTCTSCEMRIENKLKKTEGIIDVKAIYSSSNVYLTYDANVISLDAICDVIEKLDYSVKNKPANTAETQIKVQKDNLKKGNSQKDKSKKDKSSDKMPITQLLGVFIIIFALYVIIKNTVGFNFIPQVNQNIGYGILFVVGLITSLHCIAMCGGINLSQCVSYKQEADSEASARQMSI